MRRTAHVLLSCLLGVSPSVADAGDAVLVVAPGDRIEIVPPADGLYLEAALGGAVLRPSDGRLEAPGEGVHWLAVASRDAIGNRSDVRWTRLVVDGTPPEVAAAVVPPLVEGEAGGAWAGPDAIVEARATDAPAGVVSLELTVAEATRRSAGEPIAVPVPAAGPVEARARALDRVGNARETEALRFAVDATPPTGEIRIVGPAVTEAERAVLGPAARLEIDLADAESGVDGWRAEADGVPIEPEAWHGAWPAGAHATTVWGRDRVGNEAEAGRLTFVVDDQGPEIGWRITTPGAALDDGRMVYRPPVTVAAEATDAPAGLASLVRGPGEGQPVDLPFAVDGEAVPLRARDRVGNVAEVEARWLIDRTGPRVRVRTADGALHEPGGELRAVRGARLLVEVADDLAGIEGAEYVLNNREVPGTRAPRAVEGAITLPTGGAFSLLVTARDRVGNETVAQWTINAPWWEAP